MFACAASACGKVAEDTPPAGDAPEANGERAPEGAQPGEKCEVHHVGPTHACLRPLRADVPLELYVEDDGCYSGGCVGVTSKASCAVSVDRETISLEIVLESCMAPRADDSLECTSDCRSLGVRCKLPPLAAGTYRVVGRDPAWLGGTKLDRSLVVGDEVVDDECLDTSEAALGK